MLGLALSVPGAASRRRALVNLIDPSLWQMSVAGGTSTATNSPSGTLNLTGDGTNAALADYPLPTAIGIVYTVTFNVGSSGVQFSVGTAQGSTAVFNATQTVGNNKTASFTAASTTSWLRFAKASSALSIVSSIGATA